MLGTARADDWRTGALGTAYAAVTLSKVRMNVLRMSVVSVAVVSVAVVSVAVVSMAVVSAPDRAGSSRAFARAMALHVVEPERQRSTAGNCQQER